MPRAPVKKRAADTVGRGPVPRHASVEETAPWRAVFAQIERSRGKPARMRVWHPRAHALRLSRPSPFHRRARACPSPCHRAPKKTSLVLFRSVGPKTLLLTLEIAGDRPPRYEKKTLPSHRRARACPSPCLALAQSNVRGGQAPALRKKTLPLALR